MPSPSQELPKAAELDRYDSGTLGGNEDSPTCWWHDYIRAELQAAHDFYQHQVDQLQLLPTSAVPDGFVMLPAKLTAENGAKAALMGEFHEPIEVDCPLCEGGQFDNDDGCPECGGEWVVSDEVTVSWDTIKRIHEAVVRHFVGAPEGGSDA